MLLEEVEQGQRRLVESEHPSNTHNNVHEVSKRVCVCVCVAFQQDMVGYIVTKDS